MGHQDIANKLGCGRIAISPDVKARWHIAYRPLGPGCPESICLHCVHLRIHPPIRSYSDSHWRNTSKAQIPSLLKYCA